ncbi:MAG: electron transport complex subunit RsxC [Methylothermaceae bacterium]|nr:electron transport complex subunit RsxC [Methylothermaceae bacterium]
MLWRRHKTFPRGIHPPECKDETRGSPIRQFPFAPIMVIPMQQHIGKPAVPVVVEGQEVARGQLLARADGFISVPVHAPASGVVKRIAQVPSIGGHMVPGMYLQCFPGATQEVIEGTPCRVETATPEQIIDAVQQAGIVGLGGAAFPAHAKLRIPKGKTVDTLLINGVECEPYLTTDHRVMLEQTDDIFRGIRYLLKATGAERAIIAVEANKQDAAEKLRRQAPNNLPVMVEVLAVKYPQGAEKMVIQALLNREVPSGHHPYEVHVIGVNVATAAEIGRLLPHGRGIQERVITITGPGVKKKGNYRIPIGTPLRFALEWVGVGDDLAEVFLGGPMMGQAVPSLDIPITKGTNGFVAFTEAQIDRAEQVLPCIHCGYCVAVCPVRLNPARLGLLAKRERYEEMARSFDLMACFECGACSYVCPSRIPLVQYFRVAKQRIKKRRAA